MCFLMRFLWVPRKMDKITVVRFSVCVCVFFCCCCCCWNGVNRNSKLAWSELFFAFRLLYFIHENTFWNEPKAQFQQRLLNYSVVGAHQSISILHLFYILYIFDEMIKDSKRIFISIKPKWNGPFEWQKNMIEFTRERKHYGSHPQAGKVKIKICYY